MLSSFKKMDKKDEESSSSGNPYKNIEKASVLQDVRCFSACVPDDRMTRRMSFFAVVENVQ